MKRVVATCLVALALSGCHARRPQSPDQARAVAAIEAAPMARCTELVPSPTRVQVYASFGADGRVHEVDTGRDTDARLARCLRDEVARVQLDPVPPRPVSFDFETLVVPNAATLAGVPGAPNQTPSTFPWFNRGAAAVSLGSVDVSSCASGTHRGGHVTVVFEGATGRARSARVDQGELPEATKRCVEEAFLRCRVPPFEASDVKVGKAFSFSVAPLGPWDVGR